MMQNISINQVLVNEKNRIRIITGKDVSDLKESINKLGLLHPIIVNSEYKLLAGFRRLTAMKELGYNTIPAIIKKNLTELEELDVEIEENWRRKNLTPYEMDLALARRKELYDKFHPETTKDGSYRKQNRNYDGTFSKNNPDVDELSKSIKSHNQDIIKKEDNSNGTHQAVRFTKITSKLLNISERTVQRRVKVGTAILQNKIEPETIEQYKNGIISHTEILEKVKKNREKKRNLRENVSKSKKYMNTASANGNEINHGDNQRICRNCIKAKAAPCPCCGEKILICDKGYFILKPYDSKACDEYQE